MLNRYLLFSDGLGHVAVSLTSALGIAQLLCGLSYRQKLEYKRVLINLGCVCILTPNRVLIIVRGK